MPYELAKASAKCRLGGENLAVTESAFVANWFKGKELSLALGIDLCVSRIAAAINDMTQPAFYTTSGNKLSLGFWFGFILCLISLGGALVLVMVDIKAETTVVEVDVPVSATDKEAEEEEADDEAGGDVCLTDWKKFPKTYWLLACNCVFIYMSYMSFMNVGSDFLQNRFNFGSEAAGVVLVSTS